MAGFDSSGQKREKVAVVQSRLLKHVSLEHELEMSWWGMCLDTRLVVDA